MNQDYQRMTLAHTREMLTETVFRLDAAGVFETRQAALMLLLRMIRNVRDCAPRDRMLDEHGWNPRVDLSKSRNGRIINDAHVLAEMSRRPYRSVVIDLAWLSELGCISYSDGFTDLRVGMRDPEDAIDAGLASPSGERPRRTVQVRASEVECISDALTA